MATAVGRDNTLMRLTMRPWLLLTAIGLIVAWVLTVPALAKGPFDGEWKVIVSTQPGPCLRYYEFPVTIQDGVLTGMVPGQQGRYEVKGRVLKDGTFTWGRWGNAKGTLSADKGEGTWGGARVGGQICSGAVSLARKH